MDEESAFALFIAPLLSLLGGWGNELMDAFDTENYWRVAGIEQKVETLLPMIEQDQSGIDEEALQTLVDNLASTEFIKRQKAMMELSKAGPEAIPMLEKALDSSDPEMSKSAKLVLGRIATNSKESNQHQLMAIRTLGELKAKDAVPHLEKLLDSRDLFIKDYAARALAEIRGADYTPPEVAGGALAKDLAIGLPEISMLAHVRAERRAGNVQLPQLLVDVAKQLEMFKGGDALGLPLGSIDFPESKIVLPMFTDMLMEVLSHLGNFRIDTMTAMLTTELGPDSGAILIIGRGAYDSNRIKRWFKSEASPEVKVVNETEWIIADRFLSMHFGSDDLLIILIGPDGGKHIASISKRMQGKLDEPSKGPAIDLLKDVPEDANVMVTLTFPEMMVEELELLKVVENLTAWIRPVENSEWELKARMLSNNEGEIKEWNALANAGLAMGKGALLALPMEPDRKDFMGRLSDTLKLEQDGPALNLEARIPHKFGAK